MGTPVPLDELTPAPVLSPLSAIGRARLARLAALLSNCTSPYDALMTLARISATIKA